MADEILDKKIQMKDSLGNNLFPVTKAEYVSLTTGSTATTVAAEIANIKDMIATSIHMNVTVGTAADVAVTPTKDDLGTILLVPITGETNNTYIEYVVVTLKDDNDNITGYKWEQIGTTAVDLTGYATEDYVDTAISDKVTDLGLDKLAETYAPIALAGRVEAIEAKVDTWDGKQDKLSDDQIAAIADVANKANAADVYTKTEADAMAEDKASAAIDALDLPNTYAAKAATEAHIANGDIHVTDAQKTEWSGKQDALTDDQLAAANSGITATKVAAYDAYTAVERYSKTEADAMAEGKAEAAIEALDLVNTYAAKSYEARVEANETNKADKTITIDGHTLSVLYFEEITA